MCPEYIWRVGNMGLETDVPSPYYLCFPLQRNPMPRIRHQGTIETGECRSRHEIETCTAIVEFGFYSSRYVRDSIGSRLNLVVLSLKISLVADCLHQCP